MATFEERLTAIEREHAELRHDNEELKQKIELQTIAIGALVNKAALERLNERYDKLFDSLIAHDRFTSEQLADLRSQHIELDGKITGLQTEMRQRFDAVSTRLETMATKDDLNMMNDRFDQVMQAIAALAPKPDQGA